MEYICMPKVLSINIIILHHINNSVFLLEIIIIYTKKCELQIMIHICSYACNFCS
jgi:hypothetical protein